MIVYVIYKVYQDTCRGDTNDVDIICAFSDKFLAYKYICSKQVQEYINYGDRDVVEELPEFPDAYASLKDYVNYFKAITDPNVLQDVNQFGLDVYKMKEFEMNKID